jgi:predicted dehydrogenase
VIYLVGAGPMAIEYAKVLTKLDVDYVVIGRGRSSAAKFKVATGKNVELNFDVLKKLEPTDFIINSVSHIDLYYVTKKLLNYGAKNILVEKPGSISFSEIIELSAISKKCEAKTYIAYNRRFLCSFKKAMKIIETDGGLEAVHFEFSELMDNIRKIEKPEEVYRTWFLANSSHVVDMAFFAAGNPAEFKTFTSGKIKLGNQILPATYLGTGITENAVPFSYSAYWDAPGRWLLELFSKNNRLTLSPLETLTIMKRNSFTKTEVELDTTVDQDCKPGLYCQVQKFLYEPSDLMTIQNQVSRIEFYSMVSGIQDPAKIITGELQ